MGRRAKDKTPPAPQVLPDNLGGGEPASSRPEPAFPPRTAFPFARGHGPPLGSGSRLPPRQAVQPVAQITAAQPAPPPPASMASAPPANVAPGPAPAQPLPAPLPATPDDGRSVVPPASGPALHVVGPAQFGSAQQNEYRERLAERENTRWHKRSEVVHPETSLVHAWSFALQQYPPAALTLWVKRVVPVENGYEFFVSGEEFLGEAFPDRKLYEVLRSRRRQTQIAEKFVGRIQGRSVEGHTLDCGGGDIAFPPEPASAPPTWSAPGSPWSPYGQAALGMPPPSPWGSPWGAPPAPGWPPSPYGPPPWWAQFGLLPQAPPPAAPPAAIAHDPALSEMWKALQTLQTTMVSANGDAQARMATLQTEMMTRLFDAMSRRDGGGSGIKEHIGLINEVASLVNNLRGGGSDASDALQIVETKGGDKIFASRGKVHEGLTYGFAIRDAAKDLFSGIGKLRPPAGGAVRPAGAPASSNGVAQVIGGSNLPPRNVNGAAAGAASKKDG